MKFLDIQIFRYPILENFRNDSYWPARNIFLRIKIAVYFLSAGAGAIA